jgi:small subunit ribosomal protein S16
MAVKIRLKRIGAKNHPVYRVVVADGRSPRDGRFIEELGTYDPQKRERENYTLDYERAKYWLSQGAQPSETAASLIKRAGKALPAAAEAGPVAAVGPVAAG